MNAGDVQSHAVYPLASNVREERKNSMKEKINVSEIFGSHVFNDSVMKARLPKAVYKDLKKTIEEGTELNPAIADVVANEMKEWAIEKGAFITLSLNTWDPKISDTLIFSFIEFFLSSLTFEA